MKLQNSAVCHFVMPDMPHHNGGISEIVIVAPAMRALDAPWRFMDN
jgi:hypothetical protein